MKDWLIEYTCGECGAKFTKTSDAFEHEAAHYRQNIPSGLEGK